MFGHIHMHGLKSSRSYGWKRYLSQVFSFSLVQVFLRIILLEKYISKYYSFNKIELFITKKH